MLHSAPRAQRRFPADAGEYHRAVTRWILRACLGLSLFGATLIGAPSTPAADFRDDWALPPGFDLTIDTSGYEIPTAIAFVPHPESRRKSPLYFVAELRGKIKVVSRDRSVHVFADLGLRKPQTPFPALGGQNGAAGICVDEQRGYVFVTYAAFDAKGVLRNGMVRFSSNPGVFSLRATGRKGDRAVPSPPTRPRLIIRSAGV